MRVVVGFGARAGVGADALAAAVDAVLAPGWRVAAVASLRGRAREGGVHQLAVERSWVLLGFPAERLARQPVARPSPAVAAAVGTPSVAEAAALVAAGPDAVLLVGKTVVGPVTVAVARR